MMILKATFTNLLMTSWQTRTSLIKTVVSFCMTTKITSVLKKNFCRNQLRIIMNPKKVNIQAQTLKLMMKLWHRGRKRKKLLYLILNKKLSKNHQKRTSENPGGELWKNQKTPNQNKVETNQGSITLEDFSLVH